jgi:hypothetical protein
MFTLLDIYYFSHCGAPLEPRTGSYLAHQGSILSPLLCYESTKSSSPRAEQRRDLITVVTPYGGGLCFAVRETVEGLEHVK